MNLAIDIGNTFIKAGIFEKKELVNSYFHLKFEDLAQLASEKSFRYVIISSVKKDIRDIVSLFPLCEKCIVMGPEVKIPLENLYKTPQTLGMDRICGAVGSSQLFPSTNRLIIDAGTCITYDFVDSENHYHGGSISPGVEMRFKALNTFTDKLPLLEFNPDADLIGGNTQESILSGVINGSVAEMEGIIANYHKKFDRLRVILCGGNAGFFESKIKETIFVAPDLILRGLNSILLHNVSEN